MSNETQQHTLRAMAKNYAGVHYWDHLDSQVCVKAADEIAALEAECERLNDLIGASRRVASAVIDERDALADELAAIKAQQPVGYVFTEAEMGIGYDRRIGPVVWFGGYPAGGSKLYTLPPLSGQIEKYDDVLLPFLAMMRAELHANSGKGDRPGWLAMDKKTSLLEIFYHLSKLQKAVKDDNQDGIREYSADVANMSMMLADICGVLTVGVKE
jgi:hypothetical protein